MTDPTAQQSEPEIVKPRRKPHRALLTGFPVVLDACILCNATVRDFALHAAYLALYRPVWSKDILSEVHRTLKKFGINPVRIDYLLEQMTNAFPEAEVDGYESLVPVMTNEPKDRHVLAAAVIGRAQLIVTENRKDFGEEALRPYHIETIGADDFLRDLLDVDPERMLEVLNTIAEARKMPPKTIEELLDALEKNGCKGFAGDLRNALKEQYKDS